MGTGMFAHFDADPAPAHLVGNGCRRARPEEGVEDEIAGVGGDVKNALDQALGFWRAENIITKQGNNFFLGILGVAYLVVMPPCLRHYPLLNVGQKAFELRRRITILTPPNSIFFVKLF